MNTLNNSVDKSAKYYFYNFVYSSLFDAVENFSLSAGWYSVLDNIWESVRSHVHNSVRVSVRDSVDHFAYEYFR